MRVHHLDCATMRLHRGGSAAVTHCLLLEHDDGLTLVDGGLGLADVADAPRRLGRLWMALCRPELRAGQCAVEQVRQLGFDPSDVRDVVVSHLDLDHAGAIADLPHATVHVSAIEHAVATASRGIGPQARRYRTAQFGAHYTWRCYDVGDSTGPWFGFDHAMPVDGHGGRVLLVPMGGHSPGHCGIAVERDDGSWLLHAADAYMARGEIDDTRPPCPWSIDRFQEIMATDREARARDTARLAAIRDEVEVFCSHDPWELEQLA